MAGARRTLQFGPATYEVSAAVTGGQLVMPDGTTGKVKPATAGAASVLGVAMADAQPADSNPTSPLNISWAQPEVAVGYGPGEYTLEYADAAAFGDLLKAAANGTVTPMATTTAGTFDQVVARCTEPAGVAAAGPGRARLIV